MSTQTKTVLLALLLAVTVPLAGCGTLTDDPSTDTDSGPDVDGEQLRTASLDAMEGVETARIESNVTLQLDSGTITAQSEGVIDRDAQKLRLTTTSSIAGTTLEQEQYIIGNTSYLNSDSLGGWVKQNLSGFNAWNANQFSQQTDLLEDAELSVTDQRTIDGNEVYVTSLTVSGDTLNSILSQQAGDATSQFSSELSFDNATIVQHIDVDTNRVRYTKLDYSLSAGGREISMVIEQRFSEFNEPVDIALPEEAKSATTLEERYGQ